MYLGDFAVDASVFIPFPTSDGSGGAVAPSSAFEAADVKIYKGHLTAGTWETQRTGVSGITMTSPFDSITGAHGLAIDLSDNDDAGFYAAGNDYQVWLTPDETVDSQTVVAVLATFSIENRFGGLVRLGDVAHGGPNAVLTLDNMVINRSGGGAALTINADNGQGIDINSTGNAIDINSSAGIGCVLGATGGNGDGMQIFGSGSGDGLQITSGPTGEGIKVTGQPGMSISSSNSYGWGLEIYGEDGGAAVYLDGGGGNADAIELRPRGTGVDVTSTANTLIGTDGGVIISADDWQANLVDQFDGTGLIGDEFPSRQDQVAAISGSLTLPAAAESKVLTDGTATNDYDATANHDGTMYIVTDNDNSDPGINTELRYDIGDTIASHLHFHGWYQDGSAPFTNSCLMQAYNWDSTAYETIHTLSHATSEQSHDPILLARYVSTAANGPAGDADVIDIRFIQAAQDGGSGSTINVDHCVAMYINPTITVDDIWDETLTAANHNVATSAGRRLREAASTVVYSGTAQGAGTGNNQIQLDVGASAVDGTFDPSAIAIIDGTGAGQSRNILEYDGGTTTATVDRNWKVNPSSDSEFIIYADAGREHVNEGLARGGSNNSITLNALASSDNNAYNGQTIFIRSGTGDDQSRIITAYNGTSKEATVNRNWDTNPNTTSGYVMLSIQTASEDIITEAVWAYVLAELVVTGDPGATPTAAQALMLEYMTSRNRHDASTTEESIYNDAGSKILERDLTDDTVTASASKVRNPT